MEGFTVKTLKAGDGVTKPQKGQKVIVHYTGKLQDGKVFDSSEQRKEPFKFVLGVQQVIRGWDEGVAQMSVGEEALITCPPDYAYGKNGVKGCIPPNATLYFNVKLLQIQQEQPFTVKTIKAGDGVTKPKKGQKVTVHYTGKLDNGKVFDSSEQRNEPFQFKLGVQEVIRGWDEGVAKMSLGEEAIITCPPDYAYGEDGVEGCIPPDATLFFNVKLLKIN